MKPKFSIITVSYNCIDTIERAILSVISQCYDNYEYIVIDGASLDGTSELERKYIDKIAFFVSEKDDGIYYAMNKAIAASTGDYLIFLNGDDYFDNGEVLENVAPYCHGENIVIGREYCGSRLSDVVDLKEVKSKYYGIFYPHQATFVPRMLFNRLGYYSLDYRVSADFEWMCRAILNGAVIDWVNETVSHYSIGGMSSRIACDIDEYNISLKYMKLAGEDALIPDMQEYVRCKARNTVFRQILLDASTDPFFVEVLNLMVDSHESVRLFGGGYLAGLYIEMFRRLGIAIEFIIDKKCENSGIKGIPLVKYEKECVNQLFVTSEVYDNEISSFLKAEGFTDGKEFFSHRLFEDRMLAKLKNLYPAIVEFETSTGLNMVP